MVEMNVNKRPICISVANRIINRIHAQNRWRQDNGMSNIVITGMLVQKLMYLCALAWFVDHDNCKMIPEDFKAWAKGPVIPQLYDYFLVYDTNTNLLPVLKQDNDYVLSKEESELINHVVDKTCDIPLNTLVDYTQIEGGPWSLFYEGNEPTRVTIPKCSIREWIRMKKNRNTFDQLLESKTLEVNGQCFSLSKMYK